MSAAVTPYLQQEAYESGRAYGRIDRQYNTYAPREFKAWRDVPGFVSGYDVGWSELDRLTEEDVSSMPDTPEDEQFELEIDRAESMDFWREPC